MLKDIGIVVAGFMVGLLSSAVAQEQSAYFPLEVGNEWRYVSSDPECWYVSPHRECSDACFVRITGTQEIEGEMYFRFEGSPLSGYYRADENGDVWWRSTEQKEPYCVYRFSARPGEPSDGAGGDVWWVPLPDGDPPYGYWKYYTYLREGTLTPAGYFSRLIVFFREVVFEIGGEAVFDTQQDYYLAPGVGLVGVSVCLVPGWVLESAKVDGTEYPTNVVDGVSWGAIKHLF